VTTAARWPGLPNVPALAETPALKGLDVESWLGLLGPAGTPAPVIAAWVAALEAATKDPEIARKLADIANRPSVISGDKFADYLQRERRMVQETVTRANIKVE